MVVHVLKTTRVFVLLDFQAKGVSGVSTICFNEKKPLQHGQVYLILLLQQSLVLTIYLRIKVSKVPIRDDFVQFKSVCI